MNIEDLSKSQLLLLMIFVNFITSIATGVLTVSLLAQAPVQITETVNRVVDHTIEQVATNTPLSTIIAPPTTTTITKTVIQNSSDLLPAAVAAVASRTVGIYSSNGTSSPMIERGTYLPEARAVVTDSLSTGLPNNVIVVFPDGSSQPASLSHAGAALTIYGFGDSATLPKAQTPKLIGHSDLKQGETVVAITADGSAITGIISKIDDTGVHTNLPTISSGLQAVDLSGNIIGIASGSDGLYYPADKITSLLTAPSGGASS